MCNCVKVDFKNVFFFLLYYSFKKESVGASDWILF